MAKRPFKRYLWMLLFVIPVVFLYFGIISAFYRYEMRALAHPMTATVVHQEIETYTCKDSDGNRRTCRRVAYDLDLDLGAGQIVQRPLLEGNFDPGDTWHSVDMISPGDYPVGAPMAVLVRPDLDYAVVIDAFWSAYVLPIVLIVFGTFWFIASWFLVPILVRKG